ncbi:unnamed protein product, partial [Heterosigma akashiwo]
DDKKDSAHSGAKVIDFQVLLTAKEFQLLQSKIRGAVAEEKFVKRTKKSDSGSKQSSSKT